MVTKFSFFESFYEAARGLPDDDRLAFFDAVCAYAFDEVEPEFSGIMAVVWTLAKPNIDSSIKGQKAGTEGGRGKKKNPSENPPEEKEKTPSETPVSRKKNPPFSKSETNMDMDMDMERDMEREMDTDGKISWEKSFQSVRAVGGAVAAKAAPPPSRKPHCPLCEVPLFRNTQTGKWTCPHCADSFPAEKVAS